MENQILLNWMATEPDVDKKDTKSCFTGRVAVGTGEHQWPVNTVSIATKPITLTKTFKVHHQALCLRVAQPEKMFRNCSLRIMNERL